MVKALEEKDEPMVADDRTQRLTREDWLDLALRTLVEDGIDQVKIQIMAKKLNVARSSFYWHFESREALHKAMLDEWLRLNTSPIIERAMRPAPDIVRAIINVFDCWIDATLFNPPLDIALRIWARRSATVRRVVLQADEMRIDALRRMFLRYGYENEDALIRARVIYYTQIGEYTLEGFEETALRFSRGTAYLRIFSGAGVDVSQSQELAALVNEKVLGPARKARH